MKKFFKFMVLAGVLSTTAWSGSSVAATGGDVSATANYQGAGDGPNLQAHADPGSASVTANAGPGGFAFTPGEGVDLFDEAIARARSSVVSSTKDSSIGAYSHAGGYSPGFASPPDAVMSNALVHLSLDFIVHAPAGIDTAQLTLELGFDGSLLAASYGGANAPGQVYAGVTARVDTISSLGRDNWFDASAYLDRFGGLSVSGPWAAALTDATVSASGVSFYTMDYDQEFPGLITVPTNEVFTYDAILTTEAFIHGAFENWAVADFFNTGTFNLSPVTAGVTLERIASPVPLPGALALMLLPLVWVGRRYRV